MNNLQLPLTLGPKDSAAFESYFAGPNREVVDYLRRLPETTEGTRVYLWGGPGTGKSHLLQAVCQAASSRGRPAAYLPMHSADQFPCEALEGMENLSVVCIDDVHAIAGRHNWEMALIQLFERIHRTGGGLVATGNAPPAELGLELPQLMSRLAGGLVFRIQDLDDADKLHALQRRAARRGFDLSEEAGRYLVRQFGQDMTILFNALNTLDQASLAAKRKLTLPFVRAVLKDVGLTDKPVS